MSKEDALDNISTDGGTPTLSTIFLDVSEVAHKIVSFLPAKDVLSLHSVDKACHNLLSKHEDVLFEEFLRRDFAEGNVLAYIANERRVSKKYLYLAFLNRRSLPKLEVMAPAAPMDIQKGYVLTGNGHHNLKLKMKMTKITNSQNTVMTRIMQRDLFVLCLKMKILLQ